MTNKTDTHKFHLTLGILSIIAIVIFTLQNSEVVTVRFLIWKLEMSRVLLILAVLFIGFVLGYLLHGIRKK